mgnify:CR=1 FL=1
MRNNWKVEISHDGNLFIRGKQNENNFENLFGMKKFEYGICIYAHYLRPVRKLLNELFPNASIKNLEAIESIIKEEFCDHRSVHDFQRCLETAEIPYRSYSNVA